MAITFVQNFVTDNFYNFCSQLLPSFYLKLLFTTIVHNFCLKLVSTTIVCSFRFNLLQTIWSQYLLKSFVQDLVNIFVHNLGSKLLFTTFIKYPIDHNFCSQLLFIAFFTTFVVLTFFATVLLFIPQLMFKISPPKFLDRFTY